MQAREGDQLQLSHRLSKTLSMLLTSPSPRKTMATQALAVKYTQSTRQRRIIDPYPVYLKSKLQTNGQCIHQG